MNVAALKSTPDLEGVPLEKLAVSKAISDEHKLAEVSRQFEAVLLRQILGQARKTVFRSSFSDDTVASSIYQDMVTQQLADGISRNGTFGLSRSLQAQLTHQVLTATPSPAHD